jgi:hypothetical protein
MAPVELHFDGPDVYLPEGLVQRHRPPQNRNATAVAQTWELPYSLQVTDPDALEENDAARRRRDSFTAANMSDEAQFIHDFYLPFEARSLSTTRLLVHWDIGPSDPDTPHPECALALYDWGRTQWVEQVRADTGDQRIVVADPDRFIRPPFPVLRVKVAPLKRAATRTAQSGSWILLLKAAKPMTAKPLIRIDELTVRYGPLVAVNRVSLGSGRARFSGWLVPTARQNDHVESAGGLAAARWRPGDGG